MNQNQAVTGAVSEVMSEGVISCTPETPLSDVAALMAERQVHSVVVSDLKPSASANGWGVISDLDLIEAISLGSAGQTAAEIAGTEPITVSAEDPLQRAAQLMVEHDVTHLLVLGSGSSEPAGVVSTLDIARVLAVGAA